MKLFLAPENKNAMNADHNFARKQALFYRCQVPEHEFAFLSKRRICASIMASQPKNRKPVCYHSGVGGNSAAALFDMVRK